MSEQPLPTRRRQNHRGPAQAALRPIRRRSVSASIADALVEQIAQGRIRPGERLLSERDLSETFAVSRSSVREAIKSLESRGMVEGRHGGGTFVRPQGLDTLVQVPAGPVSVSQVEVGYLFEVREMLEPSIARHAAERARPADITALRRMLERAEVLVAAGRYTDEHDTRFHVRVARISGNPVLIKLQEGIMRLLTEVRGPSFRAATAGGWRTKLAGHWQIVNALEAHDVERAAAAAHHHLTDALATALTILQEATEDARPAGD